MNKDINSFLVKERLNLKFNPSKLKRFGKHSRFFINAAGGFQPRTKGFRHEVKPTIRYCGRILGRGERMEMSAEK